MDDKNLMEDILLLEKGVCDLYMHGTIESSTDNVHGTFARHLRSRFVCKTQYIPKWLKRDGIRHLSRNKGR